MYLYCIVGPVIKNKSGDGKCRFDKFQKIVLTTLTTICKLIGEYGQYFLDKDKHFGEKISTVKEHIKDFCK